jgi:hypothetical protein
MDEAVMKILTAHKFPVGESNPALSLERAIY